VRRLATAYLGVCHGLPRHALVCHASRMGCHGMLLGAMVCPWASTACHGMPRCVPLLAFVGALACVGVPWLGSPGMRCCAMACPKACIAVPWLAHGLTRHAMVCHGLPLGCNNDVNPVKNNETQQRKGTQDRSMDRFEWKTSTRCL
jgi:hypothetical protein